MVCDETIPLKRESTNEPNYSKFVATVKQLFEITKPKLIFCDGLDYQRILSTTSSWQPEIFTLSDHIEGVPKIENLLDPTDTEMIYE